MIERVSVDAAGNQANGGSQDSDWSQEGSVLVFESGATNLVPGDTNDATDVFVKNLETGEVRLVSSAAEGTQGNDSSFDPAVSPDGSRVAFESDATNLVPGDTNGKTDIFVKTLATGAIERITTASNGSQSNDSSYWEPQWSPGGTRVAFTSEASNLVPGDTNNGVDLFVKTLSTGAMQRVNTNSAGGQGQRGAQDPAWSPDGTAIAFSTYAADLVPGDTNNTGDVFVKHLGSGAIEIVSKSTTGSQANGFSGGPAWSPDGTRLAFTSSASNLDASDTNGAFDIFVKTLTSGAVQRVSTSTSSTQANGRSVGAAWSPDGTRIAFSSDASDLVSGDTNGLDDVFIKDLASGTVWRVSTDVGGNQATDADVNDYVSSWGGDWSPDGRQMVIHSNAGNLVPSDTNGSTDVFLKTLR